MSSIDYAFSKYSDGLNALDKTQFKCAFIYLTGFKPTKDDINMAKMHGNFSMTR
jgi:hypothetical protein